jgi:phosphohistidine swiveling domain-containing protein
MDLTRFDRMLERTRYWTQALNDRHGVAVGLLPERDLIWHLGVRLTTERLISQPVDVLLFRTTDLIAYAGDNDTTALTKTLDARRREHHRNLRFAAPTHINPEGNGPPPAVDTHQSQETYTQPIAVLAGIGFGTGHATGRARILRTLTSAELDSITPADILVVLDANAFAYTDWHSLLMIVQGVVAAARPAHHLTQVAREIGIPVIGHIGPAITRITNGAILHIDAEHGIVRIE